MSIYYLLKKSGETYKTTSQFYWRVAQKLMGYEKAGIITGSYWRPLRDIQLLLFKLSKEERDKYKVVLRLMR